LARNRYWSRHWFAANGINRSMQINSTLEPYVEAVKKLAAEKNVPLIDLHARSKELCERLGKEKCIEFSPLKTRMKLITRISMKEAASYSPNSSSKNWSRWP